MNGFYLFSVRAGKFTKCKQRNYWLAKKFAFPLTNHVAEFVYSLPVARAIGLDRVN